LRPGPRAGGIATDLVRVTVDFSPDLADYHPAEDADLYEDFLAEKRESTPPRFHKIWIEQCQAAQEIEDEFGTQKALEYLVGEKFLNFLEAAESNTDFRAEIPAFVARIKEIFEPWQLADYLERARETEPFDPGLFEPGWDPELGEEEIEFDAEEIEEMRKHDIRQCTRDLLLVEEGMAAGGGGGVGNGRPDPAHPQDTPIHALEGNLFGTLLDFHEKVMALLRAAKLDDDKLDVASERIGSMLREDDQKNQERPMT
jgi:hypothetical protein